MKKVKMALYETDQDYAFALQEYAAQELADTMEVWIYTKGLELETAEETDLVLINCQLLQGIEEPEKWIQGQTGCILLLSEGEVPQELAQEKILLKYQSAQEVLRSALYYWQETQENQKVWKRVGQEKEIIGVYAPGGHELQQPFSLILARQLAREKRVLYISLLEYSLLEESAKDSWQFDLSDLIIMRQRTTGNFKEKLEAVVRKENGVSYIPPMQNPENIHEITAEQYVDLLTAITQETDYEVVLIDYGSMLHGFMELLEKSDKLYCIQGGGSIRERQQKQFLQQIEKQDEILLGRLEQVVFDRVEIQNCTGGNLLESLEFGPFGDRIRGEYSEISGYDRTGTMYS